MSSHSSPLRLQETSLSIKAGEEIIQISIFLNLTLFKYVHTKKITINNIDKSLLGHFGAGHRWRMLSEEIQQWRMKYKQETRRRMEVLVLDELGPGTELGVTEEDCFCLFLFLWWTLTRGNLGEERAYGAYFSSHNPSPREVWTAVSWSQVSWLPYILLPPTEEFTSQSNQQKPWRMLLAGSLTGSCLVSPSYIIQDHLPREWCFPQWVWAPQTFQQAHLI